MVDVDPDDLKKCACEFPALFYVNPKEYCPGYRRVRHEIGAAPQPSPVLSVP
jgi:hypothetical protein